MSDRTRGTILRRRARFITAALAGAGVSASLSARAQPHEDDAGSPPVGESTEGERLPPQICLSDMDIEGELVDQDDAHPCLSAPRDETPPPNDPTDELQPTICLSIVPWSEGESPYVHDGWYLRGGAGPSVLWIRTSASDEHAAALSWRFAGGSTVGPGIVVGVGADGTTARVPWIDGGETRVVTWCFGPMADWFIDPEGGFHVGGMLGPALVSIRIDESKASTGAGGALWLGYDAWLSEQLSLGGELRASGHWTQGDNGDPAAQTVALLLTGLWH